MVLLLNALEWLHHPSCQRSSLARVLGQRAGSFEVEVLDNLPQHDLAQVGELRFLMGGGRGWGLY